MIGTGIMTIIRYGDLPEKLFRRFGILTVAYYRQLDYYLNNVSFKSVP